MPTNTEKHISADDPSRKLQPRKRGPYAVKDAMSRKAIDPVNDIDKTLSLQELLLAFHKCKKPDSRNNVQQEDSGREDKMNIGPFRSIAPLLVSTIETNESLENTRTRRDRRKTLFWVPWYGCGAESDTAELARPAEHITSHFLVWYWKQWKRQL